MSRSVQALQAPLNPTVSERRLGIAAYFLLTYLVSWTLWVVAISIAGTSGSPDSGIISGPVFLLGVFAPALLAIAFAARAGGRPAVRLLVAQIFRSSVGVRWYVFAAGYMVSIKLTAAVLYRLAGGAWPGFGPEPLSIMALATLISTPVQAGEEIGWRGYALPRLAERFGFGTASVVVGALWACWHLPIFFIPGADKYGQSFALYVLSVVAISVAMGWLYWRTGGSLFLTMLMHAAINNTKDIVPSAGPVAASPFGLNGSPIGWLTALLLWLGAAYFLVRMHGARCLHSRK